MKRSFSFYRFSANSNNQFVKVNVNVFVIRGKLFPASPILEQIYLFLQRYDKMKVEKKLLKKSMLYSNFRIYSFILHWPGKDEIEKENIKKKYALLQFKNIFIYSYNVMKRCSGKK